MGILRNALANIRSNPRLLKFPPYLSLSCMLGGIVWVLLLPWDDYSRQTYVSENALLPGQVHTYFHGSEQNIFRAYRHEVADVLEPRVISTTPVEGGHRDEEKGTQEVVVVTSMASARERTERIQELFRNAGIKSATQRYTYSAAGVIHRGENVYGILHAPRGDATESIVLVAPIRNIDHELNLFGVTLLLTLARYFSRWSLWSKDLIFLITEDSTSGVQAWIDAYHSHHDPEMVGSLTLKSGAIQGAICVDYPFQHPFHALHISYDGVNGQLPNLDLINTAISITSSQLGIPVSIQSQHKYTSSQHHLDYASRLKILLNGMKQQSLGQSTGPHSVFMPYHIDAITLTPIDSGGQDEMALGRVVESLTRSLNNLLEKLHQSFFFYLLLENNRFVSIGTYLPSAMAVATGFTFMAIYLWVKSGYEEKEEEGEEKEEAKATQLDTGKQDKVEQLLADPSVGTGEMLQGTAQRGATVTKWEPIDRPLVLPLSFLAVLYLTSIVPVYVLTRLGSKWMFYSFVGLSSAIYAGPPVMAFVLMNVAPQKRPDALKTSTSKQEPGVARERQSIFVDLASPSNTKIQVEQFHNILKSISMLVLGLQLTVLATLNFSLSMILGILCSPLAFVGYLPRSPVRTIVSIMTLVVSSPPFVAVAMAAYIALSANNFNVNSDLGSEVSNISNILHGWLDNLSFGWNVLGSWGVLVGVCCIWIPAWIVGGIGVISSLLQHGKGGEVHVSVDVALTKMKVSRDADAAKEKVKQGGNQAIVSQERVKEQMRDIIKAAPETERKKRK